MDSASDDSPAAPPRPVRKRVRTISNLTEEQIRKKRAADREAQRAVRERTKSRIHTLEQQLATSEQSHIVNSLTKEVEELRRENQHLKDCLRRVHNLTALDGSHGTADGEEPSIAVDGVDGQNAEEQPLTPNDAENEDNIDPSPHEAELQPQVLAVQHDPLPHEAPRNVPASRDYVNNLGPVAEPQKSHPQVPFIQQNLPPLQQYLHGAGMAGIESNEPQRHNHANGEYIRSISGEPAYPTATTARDVIRNEELAATTFSPNRQGSTSDQPVTVANLSHFEPRSSFSGGSSGWTSDRRDVHGSNSTNAQHIWPETYGSNTSGE